MIKEIFIDVSANQGVIDWKTVKKQGINFAIMRGTTKNNQLDTKLRFNHMAALDNDISVDYYCFLYAVDHMTAYHKIATCISTLQAAGMMEPGSTLWIDLEAYAGCLHTKSNVRNILDGAVKACEDYSVDYGLYVNRDYLKRLVPYTYEGKIWLARYNETMGSDYGKFKDQIVAWQFTSKGRIKGISGYVDVNYLL